jgi:hypothetical protein
MPETVFKVLFRHFVRRSLENDLTSRSGDARVTLTTMLGFLAAPGVLAPIWLMPYVGRYSHAAVYLKGALILLSVTVMGFVSALGWDSLYLDRLDFFVLGPLPLKARTIVAAKLAAVISLLALFSVDINLFSMLVFSPVSGDPQTVGHTVKAIFAYGAAAFGASAFIFFFFAAVQGVLINLLPRVWGTRAAALAQFALMAVLVLMFLLFPLAFASASTAKVTVLGWCYPPLWFIAVYEVLIGIHTPPFDALAVVGVRALVVCIAVSLICYVLGYKRQLRRFIEAPEEVTTAPGAIRSALEKALNALVLRHPVERACFYFVIAALGRSRTHRLFLSLYIAAGLAFILEGVASDPYAMVRGTHSPPLTLLSLPLIFSFFALAGMRFVFTLPIELRSNWLFQLTADVDREKYLSGVTKAMLLCALVPVWIWLLPLAIVLWGPVQAIAVFLYSIALCVLLTSVLLDGFYKIPFACAYMPGRAKVARRWPLYVFGFTAYAFSMAELERAILRRPMIYVLVVGLVFFAARFYTPVRDRFRARQPGFIYDEEPEGTVLRLGLGNN